MTSDADMVVVYDVDGIVTDCNAAAANLLGYSAPELAGRPIAQIIPPQLRSEHQALIRRLLGSAQVASVSTRRLARDGSEVAVHLTVCPIKNSAGTVMALCEVGGTPSPLAELGCVPLHAVARDLRQHHRVRRCPVARRGGARSQSGGARRRRAAHRRRHSAAGLGYLLVVVLQGRAATDSWVLESVLKGNPVRQEFVVRMKGEQLVAVDCDFRPLRNAAGHVIAVVGSGVDVSARKSVEGALGQSNRNLLMLSDCNHELIRASDESALLLSICQVIVDVGGYPLAWVGYAEHDVDNSVRLMAAAGLDAGQLQRLGSAGVLQRLAAGRPGGRSATAFRVCARIWRRIRRSWRGAATRSLAATSPRSPCHSSSSRGHWAPSPSIRTAIGRSKPIK